jgi:osmotically-inducible protein OsmY
MSTPTRCRAAHGTVDSERTKQRATELARQVEGVGRVVNNLKVQG